MLNFTDIFQQRVSRDKIKLNVKIHVFAKLQYTRRKRYCMSSLHLTETQNAQNNDGRYTMCMSLSRTYCGKLFFLALTLRR